MSHFDIKQFTDNYNYLNDLCYEHMRNYFAKVYPKIRIISVTFTCHSKLIHITGHTTDLKIKTVELITELEHVLKDKPYVIS